jgi:SAM-dependent methyltransferase
LSYLALRRFAGQALFIARCFPGLRHRHGWRRTARLGLSELLFDLRNGTDTSLEIPPTSGPSTDEGNAAETADVADAREAHEGTNPLIFAELVRRLPVDRATSTLLDLGAGKGRALLLASAHGFGRVIGVESSAGLCRVARANIDRRRDADRARIDTIELHHGDAGRWDIPADVNVLFLFNPFGAETMRAVVGHVGESLARRPREFYVVYLHARFAKLFVAAGFTVLHRQPREGMILHYDPRR